MYKQDATQMRAPGGASQGQRMGKEGREGNRGRLTTIPGRPRPGNQFMAELTWKNSSFRQFYSVKTR